MERPCEDVDLVKISEFVSSWETIAPYFGITPEEQTEIARDFAQQYELQKQGMLRKWKSRNGNDATYQKLLDIFAGQGENAIADRIRDEIVGKREATEVGEPSQQQTASRVEPDRPKLGT